MKKEFENKKQMVGLEEINQVEKIEINGGCEFCVPPGPPINCYWNIPPSGGPIIIKFPPIFR